MYDLEETKQQMLYKFKAMRNCFIYAILCNPEFRTTGIPIDGNLT